MSQVQLAAALRCARKSLGLSVAKAGGLAGVSPSTIKRWEAGRILPPVKEAEGYMDRLGVSADSEFRAPVRGQSFSGETDDTGRPVQRLLRGKRRRNMLTLQEVSAATGFSVTTLYRYETGERTPGPASLRLIASVCGCGPAETELLVSDCSSDNCDQDSVVPQFFACDGQPHYWLYHKLDAGLRKGVTAMGALDILHGLMIMGDHRGMLETWALLQPRVLAARFSPDQRASMGLSLALAHLTVSGDTSKAKARIRKWGDSVDDLPSGFESATAMSHLARLSTGVGDWEDADRWVRLMERNAASHPNLMFVCELNRLGVAFDRSPSERVLGLLLDVRSGAVGPLQNYNADVAELHMRDRLGDRRGVQHSLDQCLAAEKAYGFGSPLAAKVRSRYMSK